MLLLGVAAFFLFFLYDACELRPHQTWMSFLFPAGCLLLVAATIGQVAPFSPLLPHPSVRIFFGLLGIGAFFLLLWALFFSFPKEEGYTQTGEKRPVFTGGQYRFCRHPGVWWMAVLLFCLCPSVGLPYTAATLYSILNVFLALFEDRIIFPRVLTGYETYCQRTPFLIPRWRSSRHPNES